MIRLLLLLAIIVIAVLLVRRLLTHGGGKRSAPPAAPPADAGPEDAKLVRCVECGAFVPKGAALPAPGGFRCGGGCAPR